MLHKPIAQIWRDGGMWTVASETRFGQMLLFRLAAAGLLAASLPMRRRGADRRLWSAGAIVLAIVVLIGPAWTGHAGATPGIAGEFPLTADALHLLAAGAWLGGLPPLAMLLAAAWRGKEPRWTAITTIAVQRFSLLGMISVGALLASGIINSYYQVATVSNLFATTYGQLVLIKIAVFAAMVALASVNRFYLTPRLASGDAGRRLYHSSLAETGLGFAAFGVLIAAIAKTIDNFNYVTSAVLTPMFLVAGTFFPISTLPDGVRQVAQLNPLYHCVQLVRDASFGDLNPADLGHAGVLLAFALLMWRLAIWRLGDRLID